MEKKVKEMTDLKERLIDWARMHEDCEEGAIPVYGQVIDMIKDLADAEKNCWEACYYKQIVEAMKEEEKEGRMGYRGGNGGGRSGYDHYHYANGRFAPTGRGHRVGYTPEMYDPMMYDGMDSRQMVDLPFGYSGSGGGRGGSGSSSGGSSSGGSSGGSSSGGSSGSMGYGGGRYGFQMDEEMMRQMRPYEKYQESRRHYHESRNPEDKKEMNEHAKEHLEEVIMTSKEIFNDSTPEMKKKMKQDLMAMVNAWQV